MRVDPLTNNLLRVIPRNSHTWNSYQKLDLKIQLLMNDKKFNTKDITRLKEKILMKHVCSIILKRYQSCLKIQQNLQLDFDYNSMVFDDFKLTPGVLVVYLKEGEVYM